jgi:hypothetical protein
MTTENGTGETRSGGCLCGAVRYTTSWPPLMLGTCHCKHCQRQAGTAFSVVAAVPRDGLTIKGELTLYEDGSASGNPVYRKFCGTCGSPVFTETPGADEQGLIFIKAGSLDVTSDLQPSVHFWASSAQDWIIHPEGGTILPEQ